MDEQKQQGVLFLIVLVIILLCMMGTTLGLLGDVKQDIVQTNRLLSQFQRIDNYPIDNKQGDNLGLPPPKIPCCNVPGNKQDVENLKNLENTQHDPNLCQHWKSVCHSKTCDAICELDARP